MTPRQEPQPQSSDGQAAARARLSTLLFTRTCQLTGLVVFVNEAFVRSEARLPILGICVLCMTGLQVSETVLLNIIDKFLGR